MYVYWFEATPWDPVLGAGVTVRATSCELPQATTLDSGAEWLPVLVGGPNTSLSVFDGAAIQATRLTTGRIECYANDTLIDDWSSLMWQSRPIKIYQAFIDTSDPANPVFPANLAATTVIFDGQIESFDADRCSFDLTSTVPSGKIASATYAGTGNGEGLASLKGTPKPWASGQHFNRKPVLVHPGLQLYQVHGYGPIEELTNVRERGIILDQTRVAHANTASLVAATVPATEIHVCLSTGMFRIGFTPFGDITADFKGDNTGGYSALLGNIIQRLLTGPAGWLLAKIDTASIADLNTTIPHAAFAYDDAGTDITQVLDELLTPIGAYWDVDEATGEFYVGLFRRQVSTTHTISPSTGLVLLDIDELPTRAPFWRNRVGWLFNPTVMEQPIEADAIALAIDIEPGATNDSNLDDPTQLTINEKIRLIPAEASRSNRKVEVRARLVTLGLSTTSLDAAESNWLAYRNSLATAWNNTSLHSAINRSTWNTLTQAFDASLDASDKLISEEDAKRSNWNLMNGRPPLLAGPNLTVDEIFRDPSVWSVSNFTFLTDATGEGYVQQTGTLSGTITHLPANSVPIDFNATYEASWDLFQAGAGAGTAIFYTIVQLYDAAGNNIAGDGTFWFYPSSFVTLTTRGVREIHSARFGRGTDRPIPGNAVRFSLGVIANYTDLNVTTEVRRMYARQISSLEMTSANLNRWALGDRKAVRHIGAVGWGQSTAYSRSSIRGPQRFTFRFVGPASSGTAKMACLTESATPTSYTDGALSIYYHDTADQIEIWAGNTQVAVYTGITTRQSDEFVIEYDGLYLRPLRNGVRMGYELKVGPDKTYRALVDSYYINQGVTQIDHRSTLSSAVIGGNVVDINGNPVPLDALRNNLIDTGWWKKGATIPWPATGGGGSTTAIISTPTDVVIEGLKANPEDNMRVTKTGASGSTIGGGWGDGAATRITGVDPDKPYRFVLPVRHVAGDTSLYWGIDGNSVCDINTTTPDTNPYFVAAGSGILQTDRWYIFVGFIFPRNSTGKNNDSAGIYDCRTGKRIVTGENFCFKPSFTEVRHRAFQYYGVVDSTSIFGKPVVNVVDGTEPELSTFFEQTSSLEDVSLDWTGTTGHIARGNSITKMVGATSAWDGKAVTKQTYKSNAFISGRLETDNSFIGLHELGNSNVSYTSMEHSVHRSSDGNWYYWSGAAAVLNMGTSRNGVTFANLTDWALFYDNATLKIFADGVSMHDVVATPDRSYQGCVVVYQPDKLVSNVRFGPFTENTQVVVTPLGDFDIAADYLGAILSTQFNIVFTPIIKRGGADYRTNNRMTYEIVNRTGGFTTTGYVDINNTTGSADKGRITVTNCSASGSFTVNVKYDNVIISSFVMKGTVKPAPAPTGGGGGGGTKSGSFSVAGLTASGTTFVEKGRISGLVKGTGETIRCYLSAADYTLAHTSTITRNMVAKWQISVAGAESWSDVGSAVNGSSITYIAEDFASDVGSITVNQNTAPANNTFDLRLVVAANTAGGTLTFGLGITASVAIGV